MILLVTLAVSGCARLPSRVATQPSQLVHQFSHQGNWYPLAGSKTIYIVSNGWHTGVVIRTGDVSPRVLPEIQNHCETDFVEFGWGDEDFYRAKKITLPLVLRAAFWPTPSVLHVAGFRGSVEHFHQASDIVAITLSDEQFQKVCQFISDTFARTEAGRAIPLGPGIYGESTFYRARGKYYASKTCNVWTAQALKRAGCPIIPRLVVTADSVLSQARKFAHVLQPSPSDVNQVAFRRNQ